MKTTNTVSLQISVDAFEYVYKAVVYIRYTYQIRSISTNIVAIKIELHPVMH